MGANSDGEWVWRGKVLEDTHGAPLATVRAEVLRVPEDNLLLELAPKGVIFRLRATGTDGAVYTISQPSLTISTLRADCDGRVYMLRRRSPCRKDRVVWDVATRTPLLRIQPRLDGSLSVFEKPGADDLIPFIDAVIISYACLLVDSVGEPSRRTLR